MHWIAEFLLLEVLSVALLEVSFEALLEVLLGLLFLF
jgi:hypothetical protein